MTCNEKLARRAVLRQGAGVLPLAALAALAGCGINPTLQRRGYSSVPAFGFRPVPPSRADTVVVPDGYVAQVIAAWGEPVGIAGQMPPFRFDAGNSAAEQAAQTGMHHDGIAYFALQGSQRGLLAINHEYTDDGLLHTGGMTPWTLQKVHKAQAAHGVAVIEIQRQGQGQGEGWQMVRPSRYARRITATTPIALGGPAAGHTLMRTAADPAGRTVLGTIANCASSATPWGTYLSAEENWCNYFSAADVPTAHERRWDINKADWYRWPEHDERFDTVRNPNEPNRFGWVVEIDPTDPTSVPVKRTALGRAAHEGATVALTRAGRAVVYAGEDRAFESICKFVSKGRMAPAGNGQTAAQANATLLDEGTLYVARFDGAGRGRWLPLVHGVGPLTAAQGFADQGEVLVKKRQAADAVGATKMDRPEWLAVSPLDGWVYCALTNNRERGAPGQPGTDPANPRAHNTMGHIVRWQEDGDFDAETFTWNHLVLAGDATLEREDARGNVQGDAFAAPDTVAFDPQGRLWIGTDIGNSSLLNADGKGEMAGLGNNALMACNPATGQMRRFLTGPVGCEITGATWTPDGRTLFVDIQHPGETSGQRNNPEQPRRHSNWPDFRPHGRPRSATLAIRKLDGGVIGS